MGSIIQKIADEIELHGSMEAYEAWLKGKPFDRSGDRPAQGDIGQQERFEVQSDKKEKTS